MPTFETFSPDSRGREQRFSVESFEHLMLAAEKSDFPMTILLRVTLSGDLEFKLFQLAVKRALQRHPLLGMRLSGDVKGKTKNLLWEPFDPPQMPFISWGRAGEAMLHPSESNRIDLRTEVGMRFFVRQGTENTEVFLQIHHALTDALGATRFFEDVVALYGLPEDLEPEDKGISLRPLDPTLLRGRGRFHQTKVQLRRRFIADALRILEFFINSPRPIATRASMSGKYKRVGASQASPLLDPIFLRHEFSAADTQSLKVGAKKQGGTLNELLLTELFQTLDHWQVKAAPSARQVPIRLAMPINMRKGPDIRMPACNVVSMCFIDRYPPVLAQPQELMATVVRESRDIKDNYMGMALIRVARFFGRFRNGMFHLVNPRFYRHSYSTAVLSNLGVPFKDTLLPQDKENCIYNGKIRINSIGFVPPLKPGTYIAIGVLTYANRLSLTLQYDAKHLEREDSEEILAYFIESLEAKMVDPDNVKRDFQERLREGARASEGTRFWSLPIGKNVKPQADFTSWL